MKHLEHAVLRIPFALSLGAAAFSVGFFRLVVMSARLTRDVMVGQTPYESLTALDDDRKARGRGVRSKF